MAVASAATTRSVRQVVPVAAWKRLRRAGWALMESAYRLAFWPWRWLPQGTEGGPIRYLFEQMALTPELVIQASAVGMFASPVHSSGAMRWHDPDLRAVLFFENFHVPKRVGRMVRQGRFEVTFDRDFRGVIEGCAEAAPGRETTWITPQLIEVYLELYQMGVAHSVEAWQEGKLVGGGYGLALGAYFRAESMFHRVDHASKVAFAQWAEKLRGDGFAFIDHMWPTEHFSMFGVVNIPRDEFKRHLARALVRPATYGLSG